MEVQMLNAAESKIRQMGGKVFGVLVKTDKGEAAVTGLGRVIWLDQERESARSQGYSEPVAVVELSDYINLIGAKFSQRKALKETSEGSIQNLPVGTELYTHPPRAQAVPEGWKLVPIEPTHEMTERGAQEADWYAHNAQYCYKAMIDAAPQPPQEGER